MKINKLLKNTIVTSLCFGSLIIMGSGDSKAVLQSNGNTGATYNLSDWMMNVRKMEQLGGAMGLSETLNSNLTSSSDSNNIDVHMEKNTEYGALAILSASSYGNPNKINDGDTTTGNVTGVVMNINKEWVSAALGSCNASYFSKSVSRYKNVYQQTYSTKIGDTILETKDWHSSGSSNWMGGDYINNTGLLRAYSGSIFSYYSTGWIANGGSRDAYIWNAWYSRAVIVQGNGV